MQLRWVRQNGGIFAIANQIGESLRGNTIGATGPRASERESASERVSERTSERDGFRAFQSFSEVLGQKVFRGFQRFSEVFRGFQRFSKGPLRDPLRVPFSSQRCGSCCP